MSIFVFVFLIALALTLVSTPLVRKFAVWSGFVDTPNSRKIHDEPMPLLGGAAIFAGALLALTLVAVLLPTRIVAPQVIGVLLSSTIVGAVGLADDRYHLPAWSKLASQFIGTVILIQFGIQVQLAVPEWVNILLTFIWLAGISNATNFLDNMDGLSAGVSGVAASFILLLAISNDQYLVAGLSAAILGACLGFLRYNFKPAKIFMGDAGALFLGFLLAILGLQLRFPENVSFVTWMVPVFILAMPIFDMALVVISRLRKRVNPLTTAGKDHLSHRLVNMGLSQREAVLSIYLLSGVCGMIALYITTADFLEGYGIALASVLIACYAIYRLEKRGIHQPEKLD